MLCGRLSSLFDLDRKFSTLILKNAEVLFLVVFFILFLFCFVVVLFFLVLSTTITVAVDLVDALALVLASNFYRLCLNYSLNRI